MADTDLLFDAAASASTTDLVFGADTTLRTVQFASTLPPPSGAMVFEQEIPAVPLSFAGTLSPPSGSITFEYDIGIPSYLGTKAEAPWQSGEALTGSGASSWSDAGHIDSGNAIPWGPGAALEDAQALPWRDGDAIRPSSQALPWRDGNAARPASSSIPWRDGDAVRPEATDIPWRDGAKVLVESRMPWRDGAQVRLEKPMPWRDGAAVLLPKPMSWRTGQLVLLPKDMPWRHGLLVETHGNNPWPPIVPPEVDPCYEATPNLVFGELAAHDGNLVFACDYHVPGGPAATVVVPIRSAYIVINSVSLTLLAGGAHLPTTRLSMTLDADSWTWRWSASLRVSALALLDTDGPVEVVASINGTSYRLVIEQISRNRTFARDEVNVSGRGRNALLDVLTMDHANTAARTAAQLMDDALISGWSVDFALDDWLVPAGVWSHQGTSISAIRTIAAAAGGYVQPHRTNPVLRVLPMYATAPWDWAGVTPDFELPSSVTRQEGIEWVSRPDYNRVFVSGVRDGILAQVTRTGSAGDIVAPMVTDALITEAPAGRQRGLSILGDTGRQALLSLKLPVLPETGVIEPGAFIRYVDGATTRIGVVRSTNIEHEAPTLSQTLGVETHA